MERQYIGARYVPKFATPTEWNSALSYEALTIVTHLGNSFTSKKHVPAGIDIANTKYWANTGNYNAQVEQYRQSVEKCIANLNVIDKKLSNMKIGNIIDYGADPNFNNDSTSAIQNALNNNDAVYIPAGTYKVTNTIIIPNHTVIFGCGTNSEIKLDAGANCNVFESVKWNEYHGTVQESLELHDIELYNFKINGNRVADPNIFPRDNTILNTNGNGVCLYCHAVKIIGVTITNCAKNGLITESSKYTVGIIWSAGSEGIFMNNRVTANGENGWVFRGPHDSKVTSCFIGGNNLKNENFCNLLVEQDNALFTNCHFYSDYGLPKVYASINLTVGANPCCFTQCDIEGGGASNSIIGSDNHMFIGCRFYASFGRSNIYANAKNILIKGCSFSNGISGTEGTQKVDWNGAIEFGVTSDGIYWDVDANLLDTPITVYTGYKYKNNYKLTGYNTKTLIDGKYYAMPLPPTHETMSDENIIINGNFDDKSNFTWLNNQHQ